MITDLAAAARECECGCGQTISLWTVDNNPRRFAHGHNRRVVRPQILCECGCGHLAKPGKRFIFGHSWGHLRVLQTDSAPTSYSGFHQLVRKVRGAPTLCEDCGTTEPSTRYEWASLTGNYADPTDYKRLCKRCHARFDDIAGKVRAFVTGRPRLDMQGERHHQARLSDADVIDIRMRFAAGETDRFALAKEFQVSDSTIWLIVRRRTWRHLA